MPVLHLDHVNIPTARLAESISFYRDVLGLSLGPSPMAQDMSAGAWAFDERGIAVVHLSGTRSESAAADPVRGVAQRGVIDHFALRYDELDSVHSAIEDRGLPFEMFDAPQLGIRLLFVRDPNGVMVELSAPLQE
jgi:catechol 2,3-dioxygenase-like lactoylglutathione lyase family enzyme